MDAPGGNQGATPERRKKAVQSFFLGWGSLTFGAAWVLGFGGIFIGLGVGLLAAAITDAITDPITEAITDASKGP